MTTPAAILDATATVLTAAGTTAGSRIYDFRVEPFEEDEVLPAIVIGCPRDSLQAPGSGYEIAKGSMDLEIHCHAAGATDKAATRAAMTLEAAALAAILGSDNWLDLVERVDRVTIGRGVSTLGDRKISISAITLSLAISRSYATSSTEANAAPYLYTDVTQEMGGAQTPDVEALQDVR